MILTDCYPLKLIGMANSTSAENETAVVSKAATVRNLGQPLLQGRHALLILRNNWDYSNKESADHHTGKIRQKVLWPNLFLYSSPIIAITLHSTFIHFWH